METTAAEPALVGGDSTPAADKSQLDESGEVGKSPQAVGSLLTEIHIFLQEANRESPPAAVAEEKTTKENEPPAVPVAKAAPIQTQAPKAPASSIPTRQYLDQTVVPILLQALSVLAKERCDLLCDDVVFVAVRPTRSTSWPST